MYPYLIQIGDLSIPAYPALYGLGIALGGLVAMLLGRRDAVWESALRYGLEPVARATFSIASSGRAAHPDHPDVYQETSRWPSKRVSTKNV